MNKYALAAVACALALLIGVVVGRATAPRAPHAPHAPRAPHAPHAPHAPRAPSAPPDTTPDLEDFTELQLAMHDAAPAVDPELVLQQHMDSERGGADKPEERVHMVRSGFTMGAMSPTRVARAVSDWSVPENAF